MAASTQSKDRKTKYRKDGSKGATVEGPGVWVTCVKGKEGPTVGELYDIFKPLADELWPDADRAESNNLEDEDDDEDIEKQIAKEVKALTKKPTNEQRIVNCKVGITCVLFISLKPPIDPVKLISTYFEKVERTGLSRTRHARRFTPITATCTANTPDIIALSKKIIPPAFITDPPRSFRFKIELSHRCHNKLKPDLLKPEIAKAVPLDAGHSVDLKNPELVILVELYMNICGMSVVSDWARYKKWSIAQVVQGYMEREGIVGEDAAMR